MTFLPIVARELRVAARRRSTYAVRGLAAVAAIAVCGWRFMAGGQWPSAASMGQSLFGVLAGLALGFCLLVGFYLSADCLSAEKRDGTLGLLFLTDLKGHDVVLGKLAAHSVSAFYGLLAFVPMMSLPLMLGGVAFGEVARMTLVLLNALLFSLAAGVLVSALCRQERTALAWSLFLVFLVGAVLPFVGEVFTGRARTNLIVAFGLPSPVAAFRLASQKPFAGAAAFFWLSLLCTLGLSLACLAAASAIVQRVWHEKGTSIRAQRWRGRWQQWRFGNAAQRQLLRTRLLDENPFLWLAGRDRSKQAVAWGALVAAAGLWLWGYRAMGHNWLAACTVPTAFAVHGFLKIWLASEASARLAEDRHSGALELLLSTPLTGREILRGQCRALERIFKWPVGVVIGADVVLWWSGGLHEFALPIVLMVVMLLVDLYALTWVAMWLGVSLGRPGRALVSTIVRVLAVPSVVFAALALVVGPGANSSGLVVLWFVVGLFTSLPLAPVAHGQLLRLRALAAGPLARL